MRRVWIFALGFSLLVAFNAWAFQCPKGPSKGAEKLFSTIVEALVKGDTEAVLKVSSAKLKEKPRDLQRIVDFVSGEGQPKSLRLIGYKCYPQDPGYERFYGVLCYPQKALGLDITLRYQKGGMVLHHLRLDMRPGLEKACK